MGRDVGRQHDLGRQVRFARGVEVAEPHQEAGGPRHGPLQTALGQRHRHLAPFEARVLNQETGRLLD
ncbi:MAG: hypothetical protein ABSB68_16190, partial [Acidimicrobiales bacterium]